MIAETLITHAGDLVEWCESSGFVGKPARRITPGRLDIHLTKAPKELRIFHKHNGTLLWHRNSSSPSRVVPGMASEEDMKPEPAATHEIEGSVADPSGHFLPRTFTFTLGNTGEHKIALYHSPLGARFGKAGGIYGQLGFENGAAAAWALVYLTVTPPLGATLKFVAQADRHGEFQLPLERLPALGKDAPSSTYAAKLEVKAAPSSSADSPLDPEKLLPAKVAKGKNSDGESQFASQFELAIAPGTVSKVASPEHPMIVLEST